jgi:hypothetical protein
MARPVKFTDEQAAEIRLLYEAGQGSVILAVQFGTNPHRILDAVVRAGGIVRTLKQSRAFRPPISMAACHTPEAEAKARAVRRERYPPATAEIARKRECHREWERKKKGLK